MRVIVTGADGFVGQVLTARLHAAGHDIVAIDRSASSQPGITAIAGDITDAGIVRQAFAQGADAVVHLATVPGGAAEGDPVTARRTNIEASMALGEAAIATGKCPRFIFASSIAVFGAPLPAAGVDDLTPLAPTMLYGAHKAMIEQWIATLSRRGEVDGLSLRLPGIVARPPSPSGMVSAFMSNVFHALRDGRPFVSPVSEGATMWLISRAAVVDALVHALRLDATLPADRAVTLPALRVTMTELVGAIAAACDSDKALVSYRPDPAIEAGFGNQPLLRTPRAEALGFRHDGTLARLVDAALSTISAQGTTA
ncbi:NAD-dependent epimerase/dehydratase family protein [Sphingomonas sp. MMSM20]|uniref:NAD-dependent epimerase/dehydratase family protein n=1 Tax=Sphingomonas lycopersici TaxID=2951807 RepID=UPI0022378817|nr:NAD-dependent epimerase/dehydratase family protein [Sphingomonas lycopersici]MCW6528631.1 NAD-dependent epimerase/dehydratase family protein [Sphingomonas lycopersici]